MLCKNKKLLSVSALAASLSAPATTLAQGLLEEITVTAQRREESLQDAAISITAFSGQQLERLGVAEALDMARLVPNLIGHNNTGLGSANTYSIRALNNTESIATFDPPVGTYIDDFFIQRQNANNFSLFDIERIEVSRGPQGTVFGRNTTGGAIRVILKKPAEERGGFVEMGYGRFDRFNFRGSVDLPVSENFLTKISAYYINDDGFVDNLTTGEEGLNSEETAGVRGAFQWRINESLTWDASVTWSQMDHANMINFAIDAPGGPRHTTTGLREDTAPFVGQITGDKQNETLGNKVESLFFTSDISWETGIGMVNILTSYNMLDQDFLLDFFEGTTPVGGFVIANQSEHDQFTQELKLVGSALDGRVDYTTGFFYFKEDNKTDFADIFGGFVLADRIIDNESEAWALYGQVDWHLTDKFTLTGGIRYTDEEKTFSIAGTSFLGPLSDASLAAAGIPDTISEKVWTPKVGAEYAFNDDLMVYVSATRGFKSGGWNARGTTVGALLPFGTESVWSYEGGMRAEWLDGRLRTNVNLFWMDVTDYQLPSAFVPPGGALTFITRNFADMENKGIELEITANPIERLNMFVNFAYQDAEFKNLNANVLNQQQLCINTGAQCGQGIVGPDGSIQTPNRAPEITLATGASYVQPVAGAMNLVPNITLIHYGEQTISTSGLGAPLQPQFLGPPSQPKFGGTVLDGYTTINAGITLENTAQNWDLTLECKNCTDRDRRTSNLPPFIYLDDPMTWRLVGRYRF